jgi:hypothetical protein
MKATSVLLARLAAGAWVIEATIYLIVTVVYPQVVLVSLPWALAMLVMGLQLADGRPSKRWLVSSIVLAALSIVAIWTSANRDVWAYVVSPAIAGVASVLALLADRADARREARSAS